MYVMIEYIRLEHMQIYSHVGLILLIQLSKKLHFIQQLAYIHTNPNWIWHIPLYNGRKAH